MKTGLLVKFDLVIDRVIQKDKVFYPVVIVIIAAIFAIVIWLHEIVAYLSNLGKL